MTFKDFHYERPNCDELFDLIASTKDSFLNSSTFEEQLSLYKTLRTGLAKVESLATIAYVRNTINTKDAYYEQEKKYMDSMYPLINEKMLDINELIYHSEFKENFRTELGDVYIKNLELKLKSFSPEIVKLAQEENALTSQYQKLYASAMVEFDGKTMPLPMLGPYKQDPDRNIRKAAFEVEGKFFDNHQEEFDEIFDQLVKNRTLQATKLGFKNFVELGYARRSRNCYEPKDVANYRQQILAHIVPLVSEIKKRQQLRTSITDAKFYDDSFTFPDGNPIPKGTPEELLAHTKTMYQELSAETGEFINMMFEKDLFDVISRDGKAPGGYCTTIEDHECPFIFSNFNGTAGDVDVLTHEAGHAFAAFVTAREIPYSELRDPSMEGCEVHSMAMEYLTAPWHHLFFGKDTEKYTISHSESSLAFLPYGTMVDYFQELVYSNPDMTKEERNTLWLNLEKQFRPHLDFADLPFYSRGAGWQRQLHVYLYPFYYIDYCMASTVALQMQALALEDKEKAWDTYMKFTKMGGTKTFVELVRTINLIPPIDDGCLKETCSTIKNWLFNLY